MMPIVTDVLFRVDRRDNSYKVSIDGFKRSWNVVSKYTTDVKLYKTQLWWIIETVF